MKPLGPRNNRKHVSIDGTVAGIEYNRPHRGYNRSVFDQQPAVGPAQPSQSYTPDPGTPDFPESKYEQYEWQADVNPTPQFRMPLPKTNPPAQLGYDACLISDEQSQLAFQEAIANQKGDDDVLPGREVRAQGIMTGLDSLEQAVCEPAYADPVQEMASAFDQQVQKLEAQFSDPTPPPSPEPPPPEPEDLWNQYMNQFGMGMGGPGMGM